MKNIHDEIGVKVQYIMCFSVETDSLDCFATFDWYFRLPWIYTLQMSSISSISQLDQLAKLNSFITSEDM